MMGGATNANGAMHDIKDEKWSLWKEMEVKKT